MISHTFYTKLIHLVPFFSEIFMIGDDMSQENRIRYRCDKCFKTYSQKYNLQRHVQIECGQMPRNPCPYCPYVAKRKNVLNRHIASFHKQNLPADNELLWYIIMLIKQVKCFDIQQHCTVLFKLIHKYT